MTNESRSPQSDEVDELMRNAELRDELERYVDESITCVNVHKLTLAAENDFLASMLEWEQAPILPIYRWFEPELRPPRPESLSDVRLEMILWDTIRKLYQKRIVLDFTDHLSDRELYCLIYRDILPAREKKLEHISHYLHWDCTGPSGDPDVLAAVLCQRRGARRMGRLLWPADARPRVAAVSEDSAAGARVGRSKEQQCRVARNAISESG